MRTSSRIAARTCTTCRTRSRATPRGFGLDFFPIIFEVLDYRPMNEVAAYGGFPTRYPHWRFGMEYEQLAKSYEYGLSKIYEMVINNNPSYAYLLEGNSLVDQKLVMAHVYGHVDFFKNNFYFSKTNRQDDRRHGRTTPSTRWPATAHRRRHGASITVEDFIDVCLSLENLIDPMSPYIQRAGRAAAERARTTDEAAEIPRLRAKDYMDDLHQPARVPRAAAAEDGGGEAARRSASPRSRERDVLGFLHRPRAARALGARRASSIIRDEAYYFAPQAQTKIMNEGWATYWHSKIMTEKALTRGRDHRLRRRLRRACWRTSRRAAQPLQARASSCSATSRSAGTRASSARSGTSATTSRPSATGTAGSGLGRQKIFEVRTLYNDVTFIDEFLTLEFCLEQKFYHLRLQRALGQLGDRCRASSRR